MDVESRWGADAVNPAEPSLPGLKARFLIDHLPETGKVLEIGCGDGKLLRTIAHYRPELELLGCDVREPGTPPDAYAFRLIENERLPYDDASLDVVLLFDVLEHVPDPKQTLGEAARVLRPGGKLVVFVPVEGETVSAYALWRRLLGKDLYVETKEHIQSFSHRALRELLDERFDVRDATYAYHPLGQLMDASFFAATRLEKLRTFWWRSNVFYRPEEAKKAQGAAGAMNKLLVVGNFLAWAESRALRNVRAGSAGLLASAVVRK